MSRRSIPVLSVNTGTIKIADLRTRIAATGVALPAELEFVDNGYSGATLIRPALERLLSLLRQGPPAAYVGEVQKVWGKPTEHLSGFHVRW